MKKILICICTLLEISVFASAQTPGSPIDSSQYPPIELPQVNITYVVDKGPGSLLRYDIIKKQFDTTSINAAPDDGITTFPPSQRITEQEINRNALKVTGFSALQPADMLTGFPGYPFSAIVKLEVVYSTGQQSSCSGAMISKDYVLTAAHCVYNQQNGGFASSINVVPAYNMGNRPFGNISAVKWNAFTAYTASGDWNYDVAVIQTSTPIGNQTGWLGWGPNMNNAFFTNPSNTMNAIGYPGSDFYGNPVLEQGHRMYAWSGYQDYWESNNSVCHNNVGYKGQSGSALYQKTATDRIAYGVLSHGGPAPAHICYCRLDNNMVAEMARIIQPQPPAGVGVQTARHTVQITTYPNPANHTLTVHFGENSFQTGIVEIWSPQGTLIKRIDAANKKLLEIDVENIPAGTYLLRATLDGRCYVGKIVKAGTQ